MALWHVHLSCWEMSSLSRKTPEGELSTCLHHHFTLQLHLPQNAAYLLYVAGKPLTSTFYYEAWISNALSPSRAFTILKPLSTVDHDSSRSQATGQNHCMSLDFPILGRYRSYNDSSLASAPLTYFPYRVTSPKRREATYNFAVDSGDNVLAQSVQYSIYLYIHNN